MSLRERIFLADDRQPLKVHVPEWDADLFLKVLSMPERLEFQRWAKDQGDERDGRFEAAILTRTATDEAGSLVFEPGDVDVLVQKHPGVIQWLAMAAVELNRMGKASIETARKNSEAAQSSTSSLPSPGA